MAHKVRNFKFYSRFAHFVPGVADLIKLCLWFIAGALLGNLVSLGVSALAGPELSAEYSMLVAYPVMFIPAMIYASVRSGMASYNTEAVELDRSGVASPLLTGSVCALAVFSASFCVDAVNAVMPDMPSYLKDVLEAMTSGNIWVNLLCVSVFAPFFEEWLCRGMVLRGLLGNGVRPLWAVIISALFFAVIHANPWQAVPAFALGLLFGYVYYKTGSLKLTMLMHCVNNTVAVLLTRVDGLENAETWMDVMPARPYWICFAACAIIIVLSVRYLNRKFN